MHEWQSLSHVRWDCKYHVVILPKYRRKVLYGKLRRQIGAILRELCRQRGIELLEGHAMPHPPVPEHPAQVQRGVRHRLAEGQECGADPSGTPARAADDRAALLGHGVLCQHGRAG